ncbi:MAG: hypothetical protein JWM11_3138 [Planctomycetaceae bacterium]|nr:hypothetical protein [Planctomycetaceae bacterium]
MSRRSLSLLLTLLLSMTLLGMPGCGGGDPGLEALKKRKLEAETIEAEAKARLATPMLMYNTSQDK